MQSYNSERIKPAVKRENSWGVPGPAAPGPVTIFKISACYGRILVHQSRNFRTEAEFWQVAACPIGILTHTLPTRCPELTPSPGALQNSALKRSFWGYLLVSELFRLSRDPARAVSLGRKVPGPMLSYLGLNIRVLCQFT